MISRSILAAVLAIGIAVPALAQVGVDVKTPEGDVGVKAPGVNVDVGASAKPAPADDWVGRYVYSADGKHLGEIAAISGDKVYADIGGFLGIGETRVLLDSAQIKTVQANRIDLTLTEKEAKALPAADKETAAPK
jgi:hypothetical protein